MLIHVKQGRKLCKKKKEKQEKEKEEKEVCPNSAHKRNIHSP